MPVAPSGIATTERPVAALVAAALRFAADPGGWPVAPQFDAERRWYARLATADSADVEVWALTWLPGQSTDLHDHGGSSGVFVVVGGLLDAECVNTTAGQASGRRPACGNVPSVEVRTGP